MLCRQKYTNSPVTIPLISSPGGLTQTFIALSVQFSPSPRLVWFTLCVDMNLADRCLLNPVGRARHPAAAAGRGGLKGVANEIICCREGGGAISSSSMFACF